MRYLLLTLLLVGCTSVPVKQKFPEVPKVMQEKCPELKVIVENAKLSDISKTIAENYTAYHECNIKNDAWIEWYDTQRKIFESVK